MGWTDRFWAASHWMLDTSIHAVADTLNTCSTLACTFGGVAFAVSNALTLQEVSISYYGAVRVLANVSIGIEITSFGLGFNQSLPVAYHNQVDNGTYYNLTNYISSDFVRTFGAICAVSGIVLGTLSANINKYQQSREERYSHEGSQNTIARPPLKEYLYVSLRATASSMANVAITNTSLSAAIHFSGAIIPTFTYPLHGREYVNSPHYNGSVISAPFSIRIKLDDSNFTIPFFFGHIDGVIKKSVDIKANATYGGGFFFKATEVSKTSAMVPAEIITTIIGGSAYLAKNFFAKKTRQLHKERLQQEEDKRDYLALIN